MPRPAARWRIVDRAEQILASEGVPFRGERVDMGAARLPQ
jgi:hypothetical protein